MPNTAEFRLYEELNDFLLPEYYKQSFPYTFNGHPAIKDSIEALGVPHSEVELIIVNGGSVGFDYQLQNHDRVSVYPVFESLDITPLVQLRERPLRNPCFILDVHLGKLARLLRMLGFDSLYRNDFTDQEIIAISAHEKRIILTRDIGLLKNGAVTHGYWVRSTHPEEQIRELVHRLQLHSLIHMFSRCMNCNGLLQPVAKNAIESCLPPRTARYYHNFYQCNTCGNIYWQGSHYIKMVEKIRKIVDL
jgi:uncharacterized protein